jgi:hypothetical protein
MNYQPRKCAYCEEKFIPKRRNRKFCSDTCKQYNYLTKKTGKVYGIDKNLLIEKANAETEPLVIGEQVLSNIIPLQLVEKTIVITYEYAGSTKVMHPPYPCELCKWESTFTG